MTEEGTMGNNTQCCHQVVRESDTGLPMLGKNVAVMGIKS